MRQKKKKGAQPKPGMESAVLAAFKKRAEKLGLDIPDADKMSFTDSFLNDNQSCFGESQYTMYGEESGVEEVEIKDIKF